MTLTPTPTLTLALALSLSLSLSLSLTLSLNPSPHPNPNLLRTQALSLVADSALTPLRLASYDVLWMLDMQPGLQPYVMEAATLCAQAATVCDTRCCGCSTWTLRRTSTRCPSAACGTTYATQGSNPGLADRVPARPAPHTFESRLGQDGVASSFGAAGGGWDVVSANGVQQSRKGCGGLPHDWCYCPLSATAALQP